MAGCSDGEAPEPAAGDDPVLYLDYRVSGSEEEGEVTVLLQFRENSPEGEAVRLEGGASVAFDAQPLQPDSAGYTGVFYESRLPLGGAAGSHRLRYTAPSGKVFEESFIYTPFRLSGGDTLEAGSDLEVGVEGLLPEDRLQVALTDTSFWSEDVNETLPVRDGRLVLPADLLRRLVPGPLSVQITKEVIRPLKGASPAGGDIRITYTLSREWELLPPR